MNIKNEIQKILSKNDQKLNFIDMVNLMTYFDSTTKISKESLLINLYLLFHSYDETLFKDLEDENKKTIMHLVHTMNKNNLDKILNLNADELDWKIEEIDWILQKIGTNWNSLKNFYRDELRKYYPNKINQKQ